MKAYTAVQRKLLILLYTLWKNNQVFDPDYQNHHQLLEQLIRAALSNCCATHNKFNTALWGFSMLSFEVLIFFLLL
jgi:hypothetical protein